MNAYTSVVVLGFMLKLWVCFLALRIKREPDESELKFALLITAVTVLSFSVPHFLFLADGALATPFDIPRYVILRWYLFHSILCAVPGIYLIILVFFPSVFNHHKLKLAAQVLGLMIVILSARVVLMSNSIVADTLIEKQALSIELGRDVDHFFLIATRSLVAAIFISLFVYFFSRYRNAENHQSQIVSFYALLALFLSAAENTLIVFFSPPLLISVKTVFFTIVVFLVCSDKRIFDARSNAIVTLEAKASRDLQRIFRQYINSKLKHKQALLDMEAVLVQYKVDKEPDFIDKDGSPLPELADNMGMRLSTLYDTIKRLNINRPKP